ncbi:MAG TPA: inositol monophosphatase family protein [Vicinamibacteria bacterium]
MKPPTKSPKPSRELAAAIEAALAGGEVVRKYHGGTFQISYKGEINLVTDADKESERTIISILRRRVPGVAVLAEESGEEEGTTNRRFLVDPLDGTTNFAHGYPCFAVSIGFEEAGEMRAGVVYDPLREELFVAEKGGGAFLNGTKLQVSKTRELRHALLVTGFPYDLRDDLSGSLRMFKRFLGATRAIRRDGSAALDLCYVAAGRFDGFWEEKLGPWDTAAGSIIVTEAGGSVSDFSGNLFTCYGKEILANNGALHEEMLGVLGSPDPR